jgi:hypothetical protein
VLLKERWRSSSARRRETAPWRWGYRDHFGVGLWDLDGMSMAENDGGLSGAYGCCASLMIYHCE